MLALNIILLIASVVLLVLGLILTWKPNPSYLIIYPDMKVKKFYTRGMFFLFFMATFSGLTMLILDNKNILIISVCCLFLSAAISIYNSWYYKNISKEAKQKQSTERSLSIIFAVILGLAIFILPEISLILSLPLLFYIIYDISKYIKLKLYVYKYFFAGQLLIFCFYLSIAFRMALFYGYKKMFFTYEDLSSAQGIILFLILLFMFLFILDIKKHSPIYERQYIEENSLQPNVSNNP